MLIILCPIITAVQQVLQRIECACEVLPDHEAMPQLGYIYNSPKKMMGMELDMFAN